MSGFKDEPFDCIHADALYLRSQYREAFDEYFRGATAHHNPRAAFNLAYMYQHGIYVPRNKPGAFRFYSAAANMDGGEAEFNLALMCMRGEGTKPELEIAARHMKRSAALGCIEAQMYLGNAYTVGCLFDPADIDCLCMIPFHRLIRRGQLALDGAVTDSVYEDKRWQVLESDEYYALQMFKDAASHADTEYIGEMAGQAKFMIGRSLIEGFGQKYDPAGGYKMIREAALDSGCREAVLFLAEKRAESLAFGVNPDKAIAMLEGK